MPAALVNAVTVAPVAKPEPFKYTVVPFEPIPTSVGAPVGYETLVTVGAASTGMSNEPSTVPVAVACVRFTTTSPPAPAVTAPVSVTVKDVALT